MAAQFGVVQEVPHEPDLWDTEAVDHHELLVETGVERLKMRRRRWPGNAEGPEALVARWFDTNQLEAHSQKDVVDGEQLHLEEARRS